MVTGDPGVLMDHVTAPQAPRLDQDPVTIPHLKMEGPHVLAHHLQQIRAGIVFPHCEGSQAENLNQLTRIEGLLEVQLRINVVINIGNLVGLVFANR